MHYHLDEKHIDVYSIYDLRSPEDSHVVAVSCRFSQYLKKITESEHSFNFLINL